MNTTLRSIAAATCFCTLLTVTAAANAALTTNALTHNAITANALTHNAITANALASNAITANGLNAGGAESKPLVPAAAGAYTPSLSWGVSSIRVLRDPAR